MVLSDPLLNSPSKVLVFEPAGIMDILTMGKSIGFSETTVSMNGAQIDLVRICIPIRLTEYDMLSINRMLRNIEGAMVVFSEDSPRLVQIRRRSFPMLWMYASYA